MTEDCIRAGHDHVIRDALADRLGGFPALETGDAYTIADALAPVVRGLIADHLDAAADAMLWPNSQNCGPEIHRRATAIRTGEQP